MQRYLAVMIGAALGGAFRYVVSTSVMQRFPGKFPIGTVVVNITGCFLIGLLMPLFLSKFASQTQWRLFLVTGILGGYTTFSSFMWEALDPIQRGDRLTGLLNILISVTCGYLAAWAGSALADKI